MTRILNEKWLTKVDFSKGVIELTEWEEKIYQQGRADAIEEFKDLGKLYSEIRAEVLDEAIKIALGSYHQKISAYELQRLKENK